ncbi:Thymidylate kinase [Arthrobacter sp. SO5]|uniref:dTMP kinase n=1 Tax=Arthrobacter sp. SO5 TaxID=1897055 RepID=UPI001E2AC749|nr:thymidylate kinase [Arthrobacter sp. SO5]MCB5274719.1 Thymidylate kinase [Arthrobacter sp. SO5]
MNVPVVDDAAAVEDAVAVETSEGPRPSRRPRAMIIVLAGIDGAGKSTAGRLLARRLVASGQPALVTMNPCGRSRFIAWSSRLGLQVPTGLLDSVETGIRCLNVLVSHLRARFFPGIIIMDRYLYCQLALKHVKGLGPGRPLPWLLRLLPSPDLVFYFNVPADTAYTRVIERATDSEALENLQAFDRGYRELDDFPSFVTIDAGASPEQIVEDIWQALALAGGVPQRCGPSSSAEG